MNGADHPSLTPLKSTYADDPAIAEILPLFLNNVPKYLGDLEARLEHQDWAGAARVCHDLKGTAGGYGYPDIGAATLRLETELKGGCQPALVQSYLHEVRTLCLRARLGVAPAAQSSSAAPSMPPTH